MLPTNASVPPKIGEYAYYDSRMAKDYTLCIKEYSSHWIINTEDRTLKVACHYSLPELVDNQDFITGHGIITKIHTKIESVVLEIGDPIDDGYNYIKQVKKAPISFN